MEMASQFEQESLAISLDRAENSSIIEESSSISKRTLSTVKAGERIIEAICHDSERIIETQTRGGREAAEEEEKKEKKITKDQAGLCQRKNELLGNMTPSDYLLGVVSREKAGEMEEALMMLPFGMAVVDRIIERWLVEEKLRNYAVDVYFICFESISSRLCQIRSW